MDPATSIGFKFIRETTREKKETARREIWEDFKHNLYKALADKLIESMIDSNRKRRINEAGRRHLDPFITSGNQLALEEYDLTRLIGHRPSSKLSDKVAPLLDEQARSAITGVWSEGGFFISRWIALFPNGSATVYYPIGPIHETGQWSIHRSVLTLSTQRRQEQYQLGKVTRNMEINPVGNPNRRVKLKLQSQNPSDIHQVIQPIQPVWNRPVQPVWGPVQYNRSYRRSSR